MSRIGIVIVNFNSGPLLNECLLAVERLARKPDVVIVVDNNSSDNSLDVLTEYDFLNIIKLNANSGFAAASNVGVEAAYECDWVAFLNPDAFVDSEWLSALELAADRNPGYMSFASRMISCERPGFMDGAGDAYHISGRPWRVSHGKKISPADLESHEVFGACAGAALYHRGTYLALGGFDEDFFCYLEDVDYAFRLQIEGLRCLYVPDAIVSHIGSAITGRRSDFQVYYSHRNIVWAYFKNMPLLLLLLTLPLHILMNLYAIFLYLCRGNGRLIVRAKLDALYGLPAVFRKRTLVLSSRRTTLVRLLAAMSFIFH